ncbi:hypothetical protein ACB098_11G114100 [Castanea mollissima]
MIKGLPLKKKIEALMILIEKKTKRAKKQFRRNVALLFLSYYRPLSLSLFVLSFPTKPKKKKKFTLTRVPLQNHHFIKKNVVTCHPRALLESTNNFHKAEIPFHYFLTNVKTTLICCIFISIFVAFSLRMSQQIISTKLRFHYIISLQT